MPMARIDELVAASATTVEDHYEMRSGGEAAADTDSAAQRSRRQVVLGLLSLGFPIAFSVIVPLALRNEIVAWPVMALMELALGVALFYCVCEWIIGRARSKAREAMRLQLPNRGIEDPGFFTGFSPAAEPAIYEGRYDLEWAFVAFEGDRLVVRGEGGTFAASRKKWEAYGSIRVLRHGHPSRWCPSRWRRPTEDRRAGFQSDLLIPPLDLWLGRPHARCLRQPQNGSAPARRRFRGTFQLFPCLRIPIRRAM